MKARRGSAARRPFSRFALAIWLGVIAGFGTLRFCMRAWDGGSFHPDAIAWIWLAGSVAIGVAALAAFKQARRR